MKKRFLLMILIALAFIMTGCGQEGYIRDETPSNGQSEMTTTSTRKIIYTVDMGIKAKKLIPLYDDLISRLNEDEWIESDQIGYDSGELVLRIKTTRLAAFTDQLRDDFEVTHFRRTSRDVSLQYYDNATKIESLEAEQARLITLYAEANLYDQIEINKRLSQIETELRSLNNENNQTDQWIEYSVVRIRLNASAPYDTLTFPEKIRQAFDQGIDAFTDLIEFIILALITLLPFVLGFGPIVLGILFLNRRSYQKRMKKRETK